MSVEQANVIDFVAVDPTGTVLLVMVEGRDWGVSEEQLVQLGRKLENYAAYALDGELYEHYPHLTGKPVRIELRCAEEPDKGTQELLDKAAARLKDEGLDFVVKKIRSSPLG